MSLAKVKKEIRLLGNRKKAAIYQRFFKTGPGQYGEGDIFLGLTVPEMRAITKSNTLTLREIQSLLRSKIHEHRLVALLFLVKLYQKTKDARLAKFYLDNTDYVNNWDLVDLTAPNILGDFLLKRKRRVLYALAESNKLWERRIAIVATYTFIRNNQYRDTIRISEILLRDDHDLIHKAVGWMLREVGKKNRKELEKFLKKYHKKMPRTMLRYSIEKFPEAKRKQYMKKY